MKSEAIWERSRELALADFGRDPRSTERWRAGEILFFGQVQHTISRGPNFTKCERNTSIGVTINSFGTEFWKFSPNGSFFDSKIWKFFFNVLRIHAAITPQWLQINENSLPSNPSTGCLIYIFTVEINSKSFPVQESAPNFLRRRTTVDGTARHINLILVTHCLTQAVTNWRSTIESRHSRDTRPWILGRVECTK